MKYRDKKWLYNKYVNEKLSMSQIAKLCNVTRFPILYYLRKYNILSRPENESTHLALANHCNLSQKALEWINGEILGDGHIHSQSKYSARFTYTSKYQKYIEYISDTLKSFGIKQSGKIYKRYHKKYNCYSYNYKSLSYVELLAIRKKWYPEGKKIIPRDIKLTPLTLRQYFIGDGNLMHNGKYKTGLLLSTYGFLITDVMELIKQLLKLGIRANRTSQNLIYISTYSTKDFLDYIGKCPVKCYQYKWAY